MFLTMSGDFIALSSLLLFTLLCVYCYCLHCCLFIFLFLLPEHVLDDVWRFGDVCQSLESSGPNGGCNITTSGKRFRRRLD
jgi:hypothetical protein